MRGKRYGKFEKNEESMYLSFKQMGKYMGQGKFTINLGSVRAPPEDGDHAFKM